MKINRYADCCWTVGFFTYPIIDSFRGHWWAFVIGGIFSAVCMIALDRFKPRTLQ